MRKEASLSFGEGPRKSQGRRQEGDRKDQILGLKPGEPHCFYGIISLFKNMQQLPRSTLRSCRVLHFIRQRAVGPLHFPGVVFL